MEDENSAAAPKTVEHLKCLVACERSARGARVCRPFDLDCVRSNRWGLSLGKNGEKVYTLKESGVNMIQVKGHVRIRSTLAGTVRFMQDPAAGDDVGPRPFRRTLTYPRRQHIHSAHIVHPAGPSSRRR
jgi:hypothetical protein